MRHFLQEDTLASIFNAFVKPYVDYGILTWGGTTNTNLLKLNRTLNKAMGIMAFRSKYESVKTLMYLLQNITTWSKHKAKKLNQGRFIWKLTQKQHPDCIQAIYYINSSTSMNKNEDNNRFILPSSRTNIGRASLAYQGINLWNNGIHGTIKKFVKYRPFSKELQERLLEGNNLILSND